MTLFLCTNEKEEDNGQTDIKYVKPLYLDLGTLMPVAFSKHFMAAPTAVSSWYTFSPLSSKVKVCCLWDLLSMKNCVSLSTGNAGVYTNCAFSIVRYFLILEYKKLELFWTIATMPLSKQQHQNLRPSIFRYIVLHY